MSKSTNIHILISIFPFDTRSQNEMKTTLGLVSEAKEKYAGILFDGWKDTIYRTI